MRISIATMTWDKKGDSELVLKAQQFLADNGFESYIIDGGSSPEFIEKLKGMGHHVRTSRTRRLGFDIRDAILWAGENADAVLYTEPDKFDWFSVSMDESIRIYREHPFDCLAIGRTEGSFRTFPEFMQRTEGLMNKFIGRVTGLKGDFIYGPKFFSKRLVDELGKLDVDVGWGTLQYLVGRALGSDMSIDTIFTGADCPESQRENDSASLRMRQLDDNYRGFMLGYEL